MRETRGTPVACPLDHERRDLQIRQTVHQHLALAEGAHQGAEHAQVGLQVARRERQPALFGQPLARDTSGGMREKQRRPRPGPLVGANRCPPEGYRRLGVAGKVDGRERGVDRVPEAGAVDEDQGRLAMFTRVAHVLRRPDGITSPLSLPP